MSVFVVYTPEDGKILQWVESPDEMMRCGPAEAFLKVTSPVSSDTHYVLNNKVVKRPILPVRISKHLLLNVPADAQIRIEEAVYSADGSPIELDFTLPGTYRIQVSAWPYKDWEGFYETPA